jgi:ATP-binding protein involved in chromosome partitioning
MTSDTHPIQQAVLRALDAIRDPKSDQGLVAAGLVKGLAVEDGRVGFVLEVAAADAAAYAPVRDAAERALLQTPGVTRAQVVLTAPTPTVVTRRSAQVASDPRADPAAMPPAERLAGVARVMAVASGKGGVGKSTVAVNLACAFAHLGLRVGLLDADIYGPSAPRMTGVSQKPAFVDGKLEPVVAWGLSVMSIGFLVDERQAMIWRGPMASSAVRQMISDVRWDARGPLDVLVVDLPPGTGDVHLTLVQKLSVDGAIIVSTPSEVALVDARRAVTMFGKINPPVPIMGVIENMAYFPDPTTGARLPIFGQGGARAEADRLAVPFLGEIPIDIALRAGTDEGRPLVATEPESPISQAFLDIARRVASPAAA